jgi:hypothetical protein
LNCRRETRKKTGRCVTRSSRTRTGHVPEAPATQTSCVAGSIIIAALAGLQPRKFVLSPVSALPAERGRSILPAGNRIVRMRRLEPLRIQP